MKIKIAGKFFEYFNDVSIDTSLDAVASTFGFTVKYQDLPSNLKSIFKPLTYQKVEFLHDDDRPICTGTITTHNFGSEANPSLLTVSGYALPGVLEDCSIPYSLYPLESINRTLKEITERLLSYFGLKVIIYANVEKECNTIISKSVAEPSESIKDYLSKIAAQKNVVVSHDVYGNLIYFRPDPKAVSKAFFTQENTVTMALGVDGQSLHSEITTLRQPKTDSDEESSTNLTAVDKVQNPLISISRPKVDTISAGDVGDTKSGAKNSLADELKAITVNISLNRWEKVSIGDVVEVQNEELFLNKRTRFIIAQTIINENAESKTMSMSCVLPQTFTGETPKNIFV